MMDHTTPDVESDGPFPVIRVPAGAPPITPEMVLRALEEDQPVRLSDVDDDPRPHPRGPARH